MPRPARTIIPVTANGEVRSLDAPATEDRTAARTKDFLDIAGLEKIYPSREGGIVGAKERRSEGWRAEFVSLLGPSGCGKSTLLALHRRARAADLRQHSAPAEGGDRPTRRHGHGLSARRVCSIGSPSRATSCCRPDPATAAGSNGGPRRTASSRAHRISRASPIASPGSCRAACGNGSPFAARCCSTRRFC